MTDVRQLDVDFDDVLSTATLAAETAGVILREMLDHCEVREKSTNDLVTDADIASQSAIESVLLDAFPEHGFVGEEDGPDDRSHGSRSNSKSEWQWVVDPIDGTTNFAHGLRNFCVSIALMYRKESVVGVVLDPMANELYTAIRGRGSKLNGVPLKTSACAHLSQALVAISFPPKLDRDSMEIQQFLELLMQCQSVRRLGSAALNLCFVAAGRLDAYWGGRLNAWDIAAASLIATESGASLSQPNGQRFDPWQGQVLASSSSNLREEIIHCLSLARTHLA